MRSSIPSSAVILPPTQVTVGKAPFSKIAKPSTILEKTSVAGRGGISWSFPRVNPSGPFNKKQSPVCRTVGVAKSLNVIQHCPSVMALNFSCGPTSTDMLHLPDAFKPVDKTPRALVRFKTSESGSDAIIGLSLYKSGKSNMDCPVIIHEIQMVQTGAVIWKL